MGMAMGENADLVRGGRGLGQGGSEDPGLGEDDAQRRQSRQPALAAIRGGADGISTINTILSIIGIDLKTLCPMPTVEGFIAGGYSGQSVQPIALRHVMEIARAKPGIPISGMGGIETGEDAVQFMLLGAHTTQVCTGAMLQGYQMVEKLKEGVSGFMREHGFSSPRDFIGEYRAFLGRMPTWSSASVTRKPACAARTTRTPRPGRATSPKRPRRWLPTESESALA